MIKENLHLGKITEKPVISDNFIDFINVGITLIVVPALTEK